MCAKKQAELDYIEINRFAMEMIWKNVPKTKLEEKEYIRYLADDVPALYECGLVDTQRVTLDQWREFFTPYRKPDGAYYLDHEAIIKMGQYRYHKIVGTPFDVAKIRRGKYSIQRFTQLMETSVYPSTSLPKQTFETSFQNEIRKHADSEGNIEIGDAVINKIATLLKQYPSPKRRLELSVLELEEASLQADSQARFNPEASKFTDKVDVKKTSIKDLKNVLVKSTEQRLDPNRKGTGEELSVKDLRKQSLKNKK